MARENAEEPPTESAPVRAAPALAVPLRAGPLRLVFDRGELRWIRLGEREVLRGIYFAIREPGWATVPGVIEDLAIEAEPESFRIRFVCRHRRGAVAFDWQARIEGGPDGGIVYSMDGIAGATFLKNRIGFCVLHPSTCAGSPCVIETVTGERRVDAFPRLVAPHQPFQRVRAIAHQAAPGVEAEVRMQGETFETEDQRNWSDDSFKTYCPPLASTIPDEIEEGTRISQTIALCLFGEASEPVREAASVQDALPKKRNSVEPVVVAVDPGRSHPRPAIGLAGAAEVALGDADAARVRALGLAHLRADLPLASGGWEQALERACVNARLTGLPLELALSLPDDPHAALRQLAARLREQAPRVASFLLFRASDGTTHHGLAAAARAALSGMGERPLFAGGTDRHFAELNRSRPSPAGLDRLSFAFTPQVHAFDDATLVENVSTLAWLAETARGFAPGTPLAISPISLRPRVDPRPVGSREPDGPPFSDDPRQPAPFAAAWILAFLAEAAAAGFASLTFFELLGPRGVMDEARPFPVYHALAELTGHEHATICDSRSERRDRVRVVALRAGEITRLLLANVTHDAHRVRVEGLAGSARACRLGEAAGSASELTFDLGPREIVRLDVPTPA